MKWARFSMEASQRLGREPNSADRYKQQLESVGFTNVVQTLYKWPTNTWPKDKKFKELGMHVPATAVPW